MPIPGNAGAFAGAVSEVVTFDIPYVDMESVFGPIVACPKDDSILTDLQEASLNDNSTVNGTPWYELRIKLFYDPYFD